MPNLKPSEPRDRIDINHRLTMNVGSKMRIVDGIQESIDFRTLALDFQLYSAVEKVFHPTDYLKPLGDLPNGKPESYTLNPTLIQDSFRDRRSSHG